MLKELVSELNEILIKIETLSNENIKFSGVSMGAAISSDEIRSFNQLYEAADKCLYEAKEKGRNRICLNNKK